MSIRLEEKEYSKSFELKTWLRLGRFMKPYKAAFITVFLLNIGGGGHRHQPPAVPAVRDRHLRRRADGRGAGGLRPRLHRRHPPADGHHNRLLPAVDEKRDVHRPGYEARLLCPPPDPLPLLLQRDPGRLHPRPGHERHQPDCRDARLAADRHDLADRVCHRRLHRDALLKRQARADGHGGRPAAGHPHHLLPEADPPLEPQDPPPELQDHLRLQRRDHRREDLEDTGHRGPELPGV